MTRLLVLLADNAVRVELDGPLGLDHGGFGAGAEIAVGVDLERSLQGFHIFAVVAHAQHGPRVFGAGAAVVVEGEGGGEFGVVCVLGVVRPFVTADEAGPIAADEFIVEAIRLDEGDEGIELLALP